MIGICAICEAEHELELLGEGVASEKVSWSDYKCPITGETFTHLYSPTQATLDGAMGAAKEQARRNEFSPQIFPVYLSACLARF